MLSIHIFTIIPLVLLMYRIAEINVSVKVHASYYANTTFLFLILELVKVCYTQKLSE